MVLQHYDVLFMDIFLIQRVTLKLFRKLYDYESRYGIIALDFIDKNLTI